MIWWQGKSKNQLLTQVREFVRLQPDNHPFEYELLSDLFAEHHPGVRKIGIRPSFFRKTVPNPYGREYLFEGLYGDRWLKNSFLQTIYPPTLRDQVFKMFRAAIEPCIRNHLNNYPICSLCGALAEEVDHANPSFISIAERLYPTQSDSHWQYWVDQHLWEDNAPLRLPDHHPAVVWLRHIHSVFSDANPPRWIKLQSVCGICHKKITRERRSAQKEVAI